MFLECIYIIVAPVPAKNHIPFLIFNLFYIRWILLSQEYGYSFPVSLYRPAEQIMCKKKKIIILADI